MTLVSSDQKEMGVTLQQYRSAIGLFRPTDKKSGTSAGWTDLRNDLEGERVGREGRLFLASIFVGYLFVAFWFFLIRLTQINACS